MQNKTNMQFKKIEMEKNDRKDVPLFYNFKK